MMKKYRNSLLFLFSIISIHTSAQLGFQKLYGGHNQESGVQSALGYFCIYTLGSTTSSGAGSSDIALWNVDLSGNVIWAKTFGGTYEDEASYIVGADDGGLAVAGFSSSFNINQNKDLLLFKTNSYGNIVWQKVFAAPSNGTCNFNPDF